MSELLEWIQPLTIFGGIIAVITEVRVQGRRHTTILDKIERVLERHEERLNQHEVLVGRGVPPPEVKEALARIERQLEQMDNRCAANRALLEAHGEKS